MRSPICARSTIGKPACCSTAAAPTSNPNAPRRFARSSTPALDWERVLALAARHGLRPLLHRHLTRLAPAGVPAAPLDSLRDYFRKNSAFGLLLTGELLRLLAVLDDHGVEAMPFKGPAIAAGSTAMSRCASSATSTSSSGRRDVWRASR